MKNKSHGFYAVLVVMGVVFMGCSKSPQAQRNRGVKDPHSGPSGNKPPTTIELVKRRVRNLTFEKPGRRLVAARNLGLMGADAQKAIPYLDKYSTQDQDEETEFPTEEDRAAFKEALEKIRAEMKTKGIVEPEFPEVPDGKPGDTPAPNL